MHFLLLLMLGDIRRLSVLFLLCGIAVYWVDFRGLKDKRQFEREARFSQVVSYTYMAACGVVFLGTWIWGMFL